ncbi:MAG: hypothetical protein ACJAT2_000208 [Bacteriovoracaceae bacterium]|jgi:hypothetical protein
MSILKTIFGLDFEEEYTSRVERLTLQSDLKTIEPDFTSHPAFSEDSIKSDFLIDERIISFFKIAPNQKDMALVLYNYSDEEVELRWSPEFACDYIREIRHEELISLEDQELIFNIKPQQLQWVCFEKADN